MSHRPRHTDPQPAACPEFTPDMLALIAQMRDKREAADKEKAERAPDVAASVINPVDKELALAQRDGEVQAEAAAERVAGILKRFLISALEHVADDREAFWRGDMKLTPRHEEILRRTINGDTLASMEKALGLRHPRLSKLRTEAVAGLMMSGVIPDPRLLDARTNKGSEPTRITPADAIIAAKVFYDLFIPLRDLITASRDNVTARAKWKDANAKEPVSDPQAFGIASTDTPDKLVARATINDDELTALILQGTLGTRAIAKKLGCAASRVSDRKRTLERDGRIPIRNKKDEPPPLPPTATLRDRREHARALLIEEKHTLAAISRASGLTTYEAAKIKRALGEFE